LRVISGARRDYATVPLRLRELRNLVVGAAEFEAEDGLLVFALQPNVVPDALRQLRREVERRWPDDCGEIIAAK